MNYQAFRVRQSWTKWSILDKFDKCDKQYQMLINMSKFVWETVVGFWHMCQMLPLFFVFKIRQVCQIWQTIWPPLKSFLHFVKWENCWAISQSLTQLSISTNKISKMAKFVSGWPGFTSLTHWSNLANVINCDQQLCG